jgi:group I intron endonuclease
MKNTRYRESNYLPPYEKQHDSSGIYIISMPEVSKLIYIGSAAQTIRHRWRQHVSDLLANRHGNPLLQRAVNKYGIDKLRFEIAEFCEKAVIYEREQAWIAAFHWDDLFNLSPNAGSRLGAKLSDEDRLKLAESHGGISSREVLKQIAEEYKAGATQAELAEKHNVVPSSIRNYLVRLDVEIRKRASENEEIVEKVKLLYDKGHSSGDCAKAVGIDQGTALRILEDSGLLRSVANAARLTAEKRGGEAMAKSAGAHVHVFSHPRIGKFRGYQHEFRKEFDLSKTMVSRLCRGLAKEVDGWRLESKPKKAQSRTRGGKVYHFIHPKHGEFVGRQNELIETHSGLSQAGVSSVICGNAVSHKGWELKQGKGPHVFGAGALNPRTRQPRRRKRKIPIEDYDSIRIELAEGVAQRVIAQRYKVNQSTISNLCKRQAWHVNPIKE